MKIVCIKLQPVHGYGFGRVTAEHLTVGKIYDALDYTNKHIFAEFKPNGIVKVINDTGDSAYYSTGLFYTLDEAREDKLKEIGIV